MARIQRYILLAFFVWSLSGIYAAIPQDWAGRVNGGHMMYTDVEPKEQLMAMVGSGYLATTVDSDSIYVSGLYNGVGTTGPSHRARIPSTVRISIQGASVTGAAIDFEQAVYYRRSTYKDATVEQRWYAPRIPGNILVHEITVFADNAVTLKLTSNPGEASKDIKFSTISSSPLTWTGAITETEVPGSQQVQVAVVSTPVPSSIDIPALTNKTIYFITAIATDLSTDCPSDRKPVECALDAWNSNTAQAEHLLNEHINAWSKIWQSRIEVGGRLELAWAINASMYYTLSSVRSDGIATLSPGGLASNAYNGHVFWDCETWMYPPILMMDPDIAANILKYRYDRIAGAQQKAASYHKNYQGAMFPWESAFTGQEVCPEWADTGLLEQHISADISYAFMQYYWVTRDDAWLEKIAWPVLQQIAEFYTSRVTVLPSQGGQYGILHVIPPDEYAVNVSNSAYTNVAAAMALQFAHDAAEILGESSDPKWLEIASNMYVPTSSKAGIHLEYDGYDGRQIKQADVVLLGYPLMYPMSPSVRAADLAFYGPRTDPAGPAMTWSMHALAYLELGKPETAAPLFNQSYANVKAPFNVWTETPTGGAVNFLTGAGGFLQGVLFGYGGMRLTSSALEIVPQLPEVTNEMAFRMLHYQQCRFDLTWDNNSIVLTQQEGKSHVLTASTSTSKCSMAVGQQCVFAPGSIIHVQLSA